MEDQENMFENEQNTNEDTTDVAQNEQTASATDAEAEKMTQPTEEQKQAYQYQQNSYGPDYGQNSGDTYHPYEENSQNNYSYYNYQQPKKPKKEHHAWKFVVGGICFGVIAALFFVAAVRVLDQVFPSSNQTIGTVGDSQTIQNVSPVTGAAVNQISDVSGIVSNVMPSIVSITQSYKKRGYSVFGQYYEDNATGSGSGFIVSQDDKELLIVTNNHVVEGAEAIQVTFIDDTTAQATVKGTDSTADLAVIAIKMDKIKSDTKKKIKVAKLGSSDDAKVGQMAIAIGNALGYGQSVTVGYISAKDRVVTITDESSNKENKMTLLQTDAAINPGNSGGALLDINGNVIGINSVKYASSEVEGMGYAIPMSKAIPIINELMKREVLSDNEKGYLGITGRDISSSVSENYGIPEGVYVVEVGKTGSAKDAGVKVGDVITKINDVAVTTIAEVQERVNSYRIGTEITITVKRSSDGEYKEKTLKAKLKGSSTLDDLETATGQDHNSDNSQNNSQRDDSSSNPFGDNSDEQVLPWGGSLY